MVFCRGADGLGGGRQNGRKRGWVKGDTEARTRDDHEINGHKLISVAELHPRWSKVPWKRVKACEILVTWP